MPCDEIVFDGITPELYERLLAEAKAGGIAIAGGEATYNSLRFNWNYDLEATRLTVQCTDKPYLLPCFTIENHIRGIVARITGTRGT